MQTSWPAIGALSAAAALVVSSASAGAAPLPSHATAPSTASAASPAERAHAEMSRDQRIGQLFMVATPADGVDSGFRSVVRDQHVGNAILMGRSTQGANHVRAVTTEVQRITESEDATAGVPAFVSADQEGGNVQVLRGPGYETMPTAVTQGKRATDSLRHDAQRWGTQLGRSGVNTNLGPVLDTVPPANKATNEPIGRYDREYGPYTSTVTAKGGAFRTGMERAGVATTVKHFPGLGRVTGNTDTTSGVKDTVTTRTSGMIAPFAGAVDSGTPFVMMSSAYYTQIDGSQPAVFSPTVIQSMLRDRLGFGGIVMTDDVGNAEQLAGWSPAQRATRFVDAGGDMVLTARTDTLPEMVSAVKTKAESDPSFAQKVDEASLRVLRGKEDAGLLTSRITPNGAYSSWTTKRIQAWLGKEQTGSLDSATIRSLQYRIGTSTSGRMDPRTFRALQTYLGISHDGTTTWNTRTTAQVQRYLNTQL